MELIVDKCVLHVARQLTELYMIYELGIHMNVPYSYIRNVQLEQHGTDYTALTVVQKARSYFSDAHLDQFVKELYRALQTCSLNFIAKELDRIYEELTGNNVEDGQGFTI